MYEGTAPPPTPHIDALAEGGVRLESYYVNQLCSPTRTALLSGRYAYTIGLDDGVIVNGAETDMPLNLLTVADHLQQAGWRTSAYGKWDAGMTVWGSTPTCRGFDHFFGFYNAFADYFTHMVQDGLDLHDDETPVRDKQGVYSTVLFTQEAQKWITETIAAEPHAKTFSYVAHQAVHGPLEVPQRYIDGECTALVPEDHPVRRTYCGMVRSVDESVHNLTETYKSLGIWEDTLIIMSSDNGGDPGDGGSNFPLRGGKASTWEGGVRALGWIHGAGLTPQVVGSINHEVMHVTDWLPTLAHGIAGVDLSNLGRECPTCKTLVMPLDGVDQWAMLSQGKGSARNETLLDLHLGQGAGNKCWHHVNCTIPGQGAIRVGKWKLLHGFTVINDNPTQSADQCTTRSGHPGFTATEIDQDGMPVKVQHGANLSFPWCPNGWTPAPHNGSVEDPTPPPDVDCKSLPCTYNTSDYVMGGTWLFDVVADPFEHHNLAEKFPEVVSDLMSRLQKYNATAIATDNGPPGGDSSNPKHFDGVWTPWEGKPDPAVCDTNRIHRIFRSDLDTNFKVTNVSGNLSMTVKGWAWNTSFFDGGLSPVAIQIRVDNAEPVISTLVADITRPKLPDVTGAPNAEHGFSYDLTGAAAERLLGPGHHSLHVSAGSYPASSQLKQEWSDLKGSPASFVNGAPRSEIIV